MATDLENFLNENIAEIEAVCGEGNARRVIGMALIQADKNNQIYDCNFRTTLNSIVQVTGMGLDLSLSAGEAYLTPRWNKDFVNEDKTKGRYECGFQTGYQGLAKLASNNPKISFIQPRCVYESELKDLELWYEGADVRLKHKPIKTGEPGKSVAFYAVAKFTNGDFIIKYLTREQVDKIRLMSKSPDRGPWKDHFDKMGMKSAVRQICNDLPKTPNLIVGLEVHDSDFDFSQDEPDPKATNNSGDKSGKYASDEEAKIYLDKMEKYVSERNNKWQQKHKGADILCTPRTADNALAQACVRAGKLNRDAVPENGIQSRQYGRLTGIVHSKEPKWLGAELKRYMDELQRLAEEALATPAAVAEPGGDVNFEDGD